MADCRKLILGISQAIWARESGRVSAGRKAMPVSWTASRICAASTPSSLAFDFVDVIYDNNAYNRANGQIKFSSLQNFLEGQSQAVERFSLAIQTCSRALTGMQLSSRMTGA